MSFGLIAWCRFWGKVEEYHIVQTDSGEISITKFDGHNYRTWALKVKMALKAIGAWRIVTGEFKEPGKNDPGQLEAFHTLNDKGFALIYYSIEKEAIEIMDDLNMTNGCQAAWNLLEFTFSNASQESMLTEDIREDIRAVNDFRYEDMEEWKVQRKKTIETVESWYNGLKWISNGAKCVKGLSLALSLCGNFLEIFLPGFTSLQNSTNLIFYGNAGHLAAIASEGLGSQVSLYYVRAVLEEDVKKSAPLGELFQRMAQIDTRLRSDFGFSFTAYVCFSGKCKESPFFEVKEIINLKGLEVAFASYQILKKSGLIRVAGESWVRWRIGNRNDKLFHAADLCLNILDLYDIFIKNPDPEYLLLVEKKLKSLKEELEKFETGHQPHRA